MQANQYRGKWRNGAVYHDPHVRLEVQSLTFVTSLCPFLPLACHLIGGVCGVSRAPWCGVGGVGSVVWWYELVGRLGGRSGRVGGVGGVGGLVFENLGSPVGSGFRPH